MRIITLKNRNLLKKRILVVTPTLGERESLDKTVDSVFKIGSKSVDHLIITPERCVAKIKERYPHVNVISEPASCKGIYGALNYALLNYASDYQYCTFINDDDYWLDDFKELVALSENAKHDVYYAKVRYVNEEDEIIGIQTCTGRYKSFVPLLFSNVILFTQQATLIRSELFLKLGGFDMGFKLVSDTFFWANAVISGASFKYIPKVCAAYTFQEGQLSSDKALQLTEHQKILAKLEPVSSKTVKKELLLFRLLNIPTYLRRMLKFGSLFKSQKM